LLSENIKIKVYRTIILPVVLYDFETESVTLMERHRLKMFKNRLPRKVFGPKRKKETGGCRKWLNEELRDLHSLPILFG
jgi:hypothetical protein